MSLINHFLFQILSYGYDSITEIQALTFLIYFLQLKYKINL